MKKIIISKIFSLFIFFNLFNGVPASFANSDFIELNPEQISDAVWVSTAQMALNQSGDFSQVVVLDLLKEFLKSNSEVKIEDIEKILTEAKQKFELIGQKNKNPIELMNAFIVQIGKIDTPLAGKMVKFGSVYLKRTSSFYNSLLERKKDAHLLSKVQSDYILFQNYQAKVWKEFKQQLIEEKEFGKYHLANVFDGTIGKSLKIRANDKLKDILEIRPEIKQIPGFQDIVSIIQNNGESRIKIDEVLSKVKNNLEKAKNLNNQILTGLAISGENLRGLGSMADYTRNFTPEILAGMADRALSQRQNEFNELQKIQFGFNLFSSVVGFKNPKLANKISDAGSAIIQIGDSISKFSQLSNSGFTNAGLGVGGAILTGNIVGAVFSIYSLFGSGGEADQSKEINKIILENLGEIKKQIHDLHKTMNENFARLDHRLSDIQLNISNQIQFTNNRVEINLDEIKNVQKALIAQLAILNRLENSFSDYFQGQYLNEFNTLISLCVLANSDYTTAISEEKFKECQSGFERFGNLLSKEIAFVKNSNRDYNPNIDARPFNFSSEPLANASSLYRIWNKLQNNEMDEENRFSIPNAEIWATGSEAYIESFLTWPQFSNIVKHRPACRLIETGNDIQKKLTDMAFSRNATSGRLKPRNDAFFLIAQEYQAALNSVVSRLETLKNYFLKSNNETVFFTMDDSQRRSRYQIDHPGTLFPCPGAPGLNPEIGYPSPSISFLQKNLPTNVILINKIFNKPISFCYKADIVDRERRTRPSQNCEWRTWPLPPHLHCSPSTENYEDGNFRLIIRSSIGDQFYQEISTTSIEKFDVNFNFNSSLNILWSKWVADSSISNWGALGPPNSSGENLIDEKIQEEYSKALKRFEFNVVEAQFKTDIELNNSFNRLTQAKDLILGINFLLLPNSSQNNEFFRATLFGDKDQMYDGDSLKKLMISVLNNGKSIYNAISTAEDHKKEYIKALRGVFREKDLGYMEQNPLIQKMLSRLQAFVQIHWPGKLDSSGNCVLDPF